MYIRNSLKELKRALAGEVGMSSELDDIASALFNGAIPPSWRRICPQTEKGLGSWMLHFNRRQAQYAAWVKNGAPLVLWLPGLHIPATYIAATVQWFAGQRNGLWIVALCKLNANACSWHFTVILMFF